MPIYEYACRECGRRFSFLVGVVADEGEPVCPRCGSSSVRKVISRIARVRAEEEDFGGLAEEDFESPEAARRWASEMSDEFGDELGEDFEEEVESALDEGDEESEETEEDEEF